MEAFDFAAIAIGGVSLTWLLPRLIEFLKVATGLSGQRPIWIVAGALGFVGAGLAGALSQGLIPATAMPWINVAMWALGGLVAACAAVGEYELNHKDTKQGIA